MARLFARSRCIRGSFTYREDCPTGCGENAEATVSYSASPAEPVTHSDPGSPAEVSIDDAVDLTCVGCGLTWTPSAEDVLDAARTDADLRSDP